MKEQANILKQKIDKISKSTHLTAKEIAEIIVSHVLFAIVGFFGARAAVADKFLPFGISILAGCPYNTLVSVSFGVFAGSIFPVFGNSGFRYIASLFCVLAIRLLTERIKTVKNSAIFAFFIAFLSVFFTGVASLRTIKGGVLFAFCEALFSALGAYFVKRASESIIKGDTGLSAEQLCSVVLAVNIVLLGLYDVTLFSLSFGRIISALLILIAARYGNVSAGAVLGIACAVCAALADFNTAIPVMLCFSGLMAGVFSDIGKIGQSLAFLASSLIGAAIAGFNTQSVGFLIEGIIGVVIYLILPKPACVGFGKLFAGRVSVIKPDGLKKGLTMRLKFAASALNDVSNTATAVAGELSKINAPDFKSIIHKIEKDACKGCSLQMYCWETKYDQTLSAVIDMTKGVKNNHSPLSTLGDSEFRGRCLRPENVGNAVYKYYSEYAQGVSAEKRIEEIRGVVSDQFSGLSAMLNELAEEFDTDERFDAVTASRVASALKNINIIVKECGVRLDNNDRMSVEIRVKSSGDTVLNRAGIMNTLSACCDRDFDPPNITVLKEDTFISASEHATFTAEVGAAQICSNDGAVCGDAYEYFFDGKGNLVMILSDGMGTGGRAAVDSAMASKVMSRLIKSGFGFDSALKILNSSMLFKSSDESTATIDIVCLDLFTGKTNLLKAGAAPTLVRRGGKASKAQSTSLPVGILRGINFDKAVITLKKDDIILMLSDGAVMGGTDWISAELESWTVGSAQALAQRISECAYRRRNDNHQDDITVLAAIIQKT